MRFNVRSMITLEIDPFGIRAATYFLIFSSSTSLSAKVFPPYQLESQPLTIPNLNPTGLIFLSHFLFYLIVNYSAVVSSKIGATEEATIRVM